MSDLHTEDQNIATLVHPDEYGKHYNQIASIWTHQIHFVKRKVLSLNGYELVGIRLDQDATITYQVKWAVVPMLFGALLVAAIVALFLFGSVAGGTRIPVGALAFALIFGGVLMSGPKRHLITVSTGGRTYRWKSKGGDFKYKVASTARVVAFIRARNETSAALPG